MSIEVRHLSKQFGAFTALGDVTLDFPAGELVALLREGTQRARVVARAQVEAVRHALGVFDLG